MTDSAAPSAEASVPGAASAPDDRPPAAPAGAAEGGLLGLHQALQAADFVVGPRELLLATQLLVRLQEVGVFSEDGQRLKPLLSAVYCKSKAEQARFGAVFDSWLKGRDSWSRAAPPAAAAEAPGPTRIHPLAPVPPPPKPIWPQALVVAVLAIGTLVWQVRERWQRPATPAPVAAASAPAPAPAEPATAETAPAPATTAAGPAPGVQPGAPDGAAGLEPRQVLQREFNPWLAALLLGLPLPLLLLVYAPALALSRRHFDRQRQGSGVRLDVSAWRSEAERMVPLMDGATAARLDRHVRPGREAAERGARRVLDPGRTLAATLRQHGRFSLRWRARRARPSYLVLIDVRDENDLRGRLFFRWADRLRREGVGVDIWLFDGDPRLLVPAHQRRVRDASGADRNAVRLEQVAQQALADTVSRLVVVSDGAGFFERDALLQPWWTQLGWQRWPERVLFTPTDSRDWTEREVAIERPLGRADPGFLVLPLEAEALDAYAVQLTQGELPAIVLSGARRFPTLLDKLPEGGLSNEAPPPEQVDKLVAQLRLYLGENGLRWLAACAVPPVSRWELTLLIGQELFSSLGAGNEEELRWMMSSHYARLARLPWLRSATFPDWLALRLLDELSPLVQQRIREVVRRLLEQVPGEQATADQEVLALDCTPPRAASGAGAGAGGSATPPDETKRRRQWLYLGFLDGLTPRQLAMRAPGSWRQWLGAQRGNARGWRGWAALAADWLRAWLARLMWRDGRAESGSSPLPLLLSLAWMLGVGLLLQGLAGRPSTSLPVGLAQALFVEKRSDAGAVSEVPYVEIVFSGDGERLATRDAAGEIQLRLNDDRATPVGPPLRARNGIFSMFLNTSGSTLSAVHPEGVYRFDGGAWERWRSLSAEDRFLEQAVVDPQQRWLAAVDDRGVVHVVDLVGARGDSTLDLERSDATVPRVAFTTDGNLLVLRGSQRLLFDATTLVQLDQARSPEPATLANVTPAALAKGAPRNAVSKAARVRPSTLPASAASDAVDTAVIDRGRPNLYRISPDGAAVVLGYERGGADLVTYVRNEREGRTRRLPVRGQVMEVAFGPGTWVKLIDAAGEVSAFNRAGPSASEFTRGAATEFASESLHRFVGRVGFTGNGSLALAGAVGGQVRILRMPDLPTPATAARGAPAADLGDGELLALSVVALEPGLSLSAEPMQLAADGDTLVSTDANHELRLWRVARLNTLEVPPAMSALAPAQASASAPAVARPPPVALSADGRWAARGAEDGSVQTWDVASGRPGSAWPTGGGAVRALALSYDGARLLTLGEDGRARAWAAAGGTALGTPVGAGLQAARWRVSPSGEHLLHWDERSLQTWRVTASGLSPLLPAVALAGVVDAAWDGNRDEIVLVQASGTVRRLALSGAAAGTATIVLQTATPREGATAPAAATDPTVPLPAVQGLPVLAARQALVAAGFSVRATAQGGASRALPGTVVAVRPAGGRALPRSTVELVLAGSACAAGFVERQAYGGDPACVRPEVRDQAVRDNAAAASRRETGNQGKQAFGAETCVQGYVWREADRLTRGEKFADKVCVTPAERQRTSDDNAQQRTRQAEGLGFFAAHRLPAALAPQPETLRQARLTQDTSGEAMLVVRGNRTARALRLVQPPQPGAPVRHDGLADAVFVRGMGLLLTAGADGLVRFWDAASGVEQVEPLRHGAAITRMELTQDGRHLVTADAAGRLRVWNMAARRALPPGVQHASGQTPAFAIDAPGLHLVSAGADGLVQMQRLPSFRTGELRLVRPHAQFWLLALVGLMLLGVALLVSTLARRRRRIDRLVAGKGAANAGPAAA